MRFPRHNTGEQHLLDLVPVVNVVLLLTFFFLLSWSFVLQPGVEVRLPVTSYPSTSQQGRHIITLKSSTKDDVLMFFDEKSVDRDGLRASIRTASERHFGDWITLNADDSISHGKVQEVAAVAMERGFRVTIATQRTTSVKGKPQP
ncbi:MAG: biopolymer transporter ExbD [Verrucomicrobia bacterium]|nr:biopolymer transporter ExbD [Verrucomicrobiota bacterium]